MNMIPCLTPLVQNYVMFVTLTTNLNLTFILTIVNRKLVSLTLILKCALCTRTAYILASVETLVLWE